MRVCVRAGRAHLDALELVLAALGPAVVAAGRRAVHVHVHLARPAAVRVGELGGEEVDLVVGELGARGRVPAVRRVRCVLGLLRAVERARLAVDVRVNGGGCEHGHGAGGRMGGVGRVRRRQLGAHKAHAEY
jgi:hypothetical protein